MTQDEMVRLAKLAIEKHYDYEKLKYSDYLYGKEDLADEVWDFVEECQAIGMTAFEAKYAASNNQEAANVVMKE